MAVLRIVLAIYRWIRRCKVFNITLVGHSDLFDNNYKPVMVDHLMAFVTEKAFAGFLHQQAYVSTSVHASPQT